MLIFLPHPPHGLKPKLFGMWPIGPKAAFLKPKFWHHNTMHTLISSLELCLIVPNCVLAMHGPGTQQSSLAVLAFPEKKLAMLFRFSSACYLGYQFGSCLGLTNCIA